MEKKGKGTYPCAYFAKEGYCVKGSHCEFVHEKVKTPCRKFVSAEGCRYGSACMFSHVRKSNTETIPKKKTAIASPAINLEPPTIETPSSIPAPPVLTAASAWGFDEPSTQEESVYFYGAAGTANFERPKKFTEVVGSSQAIDIPSAATKKKECHYYKAGNCLYGSRCKNLHISRKDIDDDDQENAAEVSTPPPECGICLASAPEKGIYGLLNNCSCVFCLECIRSWRKEGLSFEGANQVRLCPLCRNTSYYLVPSRVVPSTPLKKERLLQSYRASLAAIPCKVHDAYCGYNVFNCMCCVEFHRGGVSIRYLLLL